MNSGADAAAIPAAAAAVKRPPRRGGLVGWALAYAACVALCIATLWSAGELSFGRQPIPNLVRTLSELSRPSVLDLWLGEERREYRSDDGRLLRVENRRAVEAAFLGALARACWVTLQIATVGSLLGAALGLLPGLLAARNLHAPPPLAAAARGALGLLRTVHALVFGLLLVGVVGLGPTAGILAIGLHSAGTYGKLFAESIESLDMGAVDAVRATGAAPPQVFFHAVWPQVLPQFVASHLYVWEYNVRDSTVLGLIGAGGLGLLIAEATALFQWGRLATLLLALVAMVMAFDAVSRRVRRSLS